MTSMTSKVSAGRVAELGLVVPADGIGPIGIEPIDGGLVDDDPGGEGLVDDDPDDGGLVGIELGGGGLD